MAVGDLDQQDGRPERAAGATFDLVVSKLLGRYRTRRAGRACPPDAGPEGARSAP
jgi:hypothetical protein